MQVSLKVLVCALALIGFIDKNGESLKLLAFFLSSLSNRFNFKPAAMHHHKRMSIREENALDLYNFYTSNCDSIHHLYNSNNSYVKSICHLDELISFPVARKECESLNLKLYVMKTKEEEESLIKHMNSAHAEGSGKKFWIFGKKNDNGRWHARKQLYEDIVVIDGEGKCLMMSNVNGAFEKFAQDCTVQMSAICELKLSGVIRDILKVDMSNGKSKLPLID
jgi:hypothetical protein